MNQAKDYPEQLTDQEQLSLDIEKIIRLRLNVLTDVFVNGLVDEVKHRIKSDE